MSKERWFPEVPGLMPPDIRVTTMGREGTRWRVVRPEVRDGVKGHVVIRVVHDSECSDDGRYCNEPLESEHLPGCLHLVEGIPQPSPLHSSITLMGTKGYLPEARHYMLCRGCGQTFDMRQLDQVMAHEHDGLREATGITGERVQ